MQILTQDNSIEAYIELYNMCLPITDTIEPLDDETYKILTMANTDIRILDRDECYTKLTRLSKLSPFVTDNIRELKKQYPKENLIEDTLFYMIPLQTIKGTITGFILRGVLNKTYWTSSHPILTEEKTVDYTQLYKKVPTMYGWYKDFLDYDKHEKPKPIILCEGLKDCIYLKQFYPYVLSNNTSMVGTSAYMLRNITDKLLLVYDNDNTGLDSMKKDKYKLNRLGFSVDIVTQKGSVGTKIKTKDSAEHLNYSYIDESYKNLILQKLKKLETFS